ncbi:MAG: diguanylate cyclase [Chitinophagales bacterium]
MKKHILLISNMIIILSIVVGFTLVVYKDTKSYQQLAENHLEKTVNLVDIDISNHIENSMSKPVMVSKTMANDEFLKAWLLKEPENTGDDTYLGQLYSYLKAYQEEYNYTTVFCVSAQTGNYYYQDGLNKTVSKEDDHDVWYYNFIASGHEYDLEIDTNEANNNNITVFVNFRVEGDDGRLLGVIGVGLQASSIEDTIRSYEKDYGLSVYIVNVRGVKNSFTGGTDIFVSQDKLPEYIGIKEKIKMKKSGGSEIQWFTSGGERKCLITKYNDTLGWYLVLEMETNSISSSFQERMKSNVLFMLISLAACIFVTMVVSIIYNKRIVTIENTDDLTGLSNRKLFSEQYLTFVRKRRERKKTLFMLDIDHFKEINDTYGHVFGNQVLAMVADELRNAINGFGIASRWGGDEFIGILAVEPEEAQRILGRFMDALKSGEKDGGYRITVSVGAIEINEKLSMEQIIQKADEVLYYSKENGRDRITVCRLE